MITAVEKELLEEYFDKYKSYFVTEYDATEKKLYLRIWLEEDGIHFQQDFFSAVKVVYYDNIKIATRITENCIAIRYISKPFPEHTIHIEGFEEPMCEPSHKPCNDRILKNFEKKIREDKDVINLLVDRYYSHETDSENYFILDLFRLGQLNQNKFTLFTKWTLERLHTSDYPNNTKTMYMVSQKNKPKNKEFGLWDMKEQKPLNKFSFNI